MFATAGLKKTFPDLAVGFDNVRISIGAEYFVHDLNNLFTSSRAYRLYHRKTTILICNDHQSFYVLRGSVCSLVVLAYQEMVYCSGSNSTSHMETKGFCFQRPLINIRRESAKMKFKSSQNCRRVI